MRKKKRSRWLANRPIRATATASN